MSTTKCFSICNKKYLNKTLISLMTYSYVVAFTQRIMKAEDVIETIV